MRCFKNPRTRFQIEAVTDVQRKNPARRLFLHNRLHGSLPPQPKHRDFTRRAEFDPLENTHHAKSNSVCEPEGREFESLRAHHFFMRFQ
jgi:hypothetical protein